MLGSDFHEKERCTYAYSSPDIPVRCVGRCELLVPPGCYIRSASNPPQGSSTPPALCFFRVPPKTRSHLCPLHPSTLPSTIHHEGLGILRRRSRFLLHSHQFIDPAPRRSSVASAKHDVFERLDDGRGLHEVGIYPLSPAVPLSLVSTLVESHADQPEKRVDRRPL